MSFPPRTRLPRTFHTAAVPGLALALALTLASPVNAQTNPLPAERLLTSNRPIVIGHRGYAAAAPENTLASFTRALDAGVDLVELDYYHSADGVPVVIHDGTLDRTTDALARWGGKQVRVSSRPANELTSLDVGSWFQPPFPGQTLPTLEAALATIQARGITLIERKGGDPETLRRLLRQHDLLNRVVVQSFDWKFLHDFHQLEPGQILGALGPLSERDGRKLEDREKALGPEWLQRVQATGARVAVWNRQVDREAIQSAHRLGLKVWVYTINEPALADQLLALGVDGLISDNPPIAWRAIALRATP